MPIVKCIRTDCNTGLSKEIELEYVFKNGRDGSLYISLLNGPYGYEDLYLLPQMLDRLEMTGWEVIHGTPGRWDRLFVTPEELQKILPDIESKVSEHILSCMSIKEIP